MSKEKKNMKLASQKNVPKDDVKLNTVENPWKSVKTNETEEVYRKVTGILNRMTPQKFDILMTKFLKLPINTEERLSGVVDLIFTKASNEPLYSSVYAMMCKECSKIEVIKKVNEKEEKVNFENVLILKCQSTLKFEKLDFLNSDLEDIKNSTNLEKKKELEMISYKKRAFRKGSIRFIGELFKVGMLEDDTMHSCVTKLLQDPQDITLECLSTLLTTVGKTLDYGSYDSNKSKDSKGLDEYFESLAELAQKKEGINLSTRIRFMLQDLVDLRLNKWMPRRPIYVPNTIDEINKEMEKEISISELSLSNNERNKREARRKRKQEKALKAKCDGEKEG